MATDNGGKVLPFVEWLGVENLYVYGGMGGDYHGNIAMSTCAYCWVRNIESDFSEGTAVGLYGTYRSEIRDSFIHGTSNPNPGGGGYLTGIHFGGADNLIENNILWQANKMLVDAGQRGRQRRGLQLHGGRLRGRLQGHPRGRPQRDALHDAAHGVARGQRVVELRR